MNTSLLVSNIILWVALLLLGFLLVGTLRAMGLLSWRVEQLEATAPNRMNRSGLAPGRSAPDFTLPDVTGREVSLHGFAGRKVLLAFVQPGCGPCRDIVPELNRLAARNRDVQVLAINNAEADAARQWADDVQPRFPVLVQEKWSVSKRYEVFATPFAFLIDERGIVASKGIVAGRQHLKFVLAGAGQRASHDGVQSDSAGAEKSETNDSVSSKEVTHV